MRDSIPRKENGEDKDEAGEAKDEEAKDEEAKGEDFVSMEVMLGAAPVSTENIGRSGRSFGVSIPNAEVPNAVVANADAGAPRALAANGAAGATFGSSTISAAVSRAKKEIGLYARALDTNLAIRSGSFALMGNEG